MSEQLTLRRAIEKIHDGSIRIPGFQRGFVWEPVRAALLMDSIYKGYPFGSVLLWRTRSELKTEKSVGGFHLPSPEEDYPIDYVLDGQQRLTSIFSTFQTSIDPPEESEGGWLPIYYDFGADEDAQESKFVALRSSEANPGRHFPLRAFFDSTKFFESASKLDRNRAKEISDVQEKFKEVMIPAETFESEDRTKVAIVFERVNRMGVELDMFELLTAWTWSEEFDLQDRFRELADEFSDFGFGGVGENNDLMLRCCAAILKGDPSPSAMIDINGGQVRSEFEVVETALRRAIDFLRANLEIRHVKFLPYSSQLIPLAAYFSIDQSRSLPWDDREALVKWFWRSTFARRYSGNPGRYIKADVEEAVALREGKESALGTFSCEVSFRFFLDNTFNTRTVATKALILMLANNHPRTFLSGERVNLDQVLSEPNNKEYHHCMPKAWVKNNHPGIARRKVESLANYAIITRSENREISDKAPSIYRGMMPDNVSAVCDSAYLPDSLWSDQTKFFEDRAKQLAKRASELI